MKIGVRNIKGQIMSDEIIMVGLVELYMDLGLAWQNKALKKSKFNGLLVWPDKLKIGVRNMKVKKCLMK